AVTHAFPDVDISILRSPDLLAKEIARLEKEMKALSRDLKFEEAAKVRDKVVSLREFVLQ
ncbi:UvrB/UvrC motif-containing protein, partial [Mycobacterium tuberculosis]|nr:UvrB/UvrC motif-containing protein [Mycobacterium tuberculosis]